MGCVELPGQKLPIGHDAGCVQLELQKNPGGHGIGAVRFADGQKLPEGQGI